MKQNRYNKSLFWHGVFALLKQVLGLAIIFFGIFFGALHQSWLIFGGCFVVGVILLVIGSSQRFDYQRRSGYIIHGGD